MPNTKRVLAAGALICIAAFILVPHFAPVQGQSREAPLFMFFVYCWLGASIPANLWMLLTGKVQYLFSGCSIASWAVMLAILAIDTLSGPPTVHLPLPVIHFIVGASALAGLPVINLISLCISEKDPTPPPW